MLPADLEKTREIAFHDLPPGQAERACALLHGLDGIEAHMGDTANSLIVRYNVMHYTLEGLETALMEQGFHLDSSLLQKLKRALARFCENVQRENVAINAPEVKSQKVFARVYEQQLHGDKDDTPEEWRAYK
jgi:hypothetical protein